MRRASCRSLLRFVHLSSERTPEPVCQDSPFAEKQESHPALLFVVPCGSELEVRQDACTLKAIESLHR